MVAPLTIATAPTEMPIDGATFREGPTAGIRTTLKARIIACTRGSSALYQNRIYISRSLGQDLGASDASSYERNILAGQGQNRSLHIGMTEGGQLTKTYCQSGRGSSQSCRIVRRTLDDKSPAQVSFSYEVL
jgi:hypothetical protein